MTEKTNSSNSPKLEFISAGCNRIANCIDWLLWPNQVALQNVKQVNHDISHSEGCGWVIFGAQNGVCLAYVQPHENTEGGSLSSHSLVTVLHGHDSSVSSVSWIYDEAGLPRGIISGGMDGKVFVWVPISNSEPSLQPLSPSSWFDCNWKIAATLTGHEGAITFVTALKPFACYNQTFDLILASGDINSKLLLWRWPKDPSSGILQPFQTISFKANYSLCASITYVPTKTSDKIQRILAVGNTDKKVRLYVDGLDSENSYKFSLVTTLEGHEDWVRSVSFKAFPGEDDSFLMLATASQDRSIRLWKFFPVKETQVTSATETTDSDILAAALDQMKFSGGKGQLSTRAHLFVLPHAGNWSVMLESILIGHDDWVYSVSWHPQLTKPSLVSASADKSLMIWSPDASTGIWVNETQLGEIGGNALGLYGGAFSPDGRALLALGYKGALHLWRRTEEDSIAWEAFPFLSGHIGSVTSVAWDPVYPYLVTVSLDQTARGFANCHNLGWREIARPQIHGYDLRRIRFLSAFRYACAADEKVIRVLDAPLPFVDRLAHLTQVTITDKEDRSQGANLPALGLSNKAVYNSLPSSKEASQDLSVSNPGPLLPEDTSLNNKAYPELGQDKDSSPRLPYEEDLLQTTLWPELDKLYGHGYELVALAVSPDNVIIASSARATVAEHASLRLFSASNFKQVAVLGGHQLTATCLAFSPNSQFLVSGSRDRSWCLYAKNDDPEIPYHLVHHFQKAHGRIIWDIQFAPDSYHFLTASRDKTVKVWKISPDMTSVSCIATLSYDHPVTALAIELHKSRIIRFAVGLENGFIGIGTGDLDSENSWNMVSWVPVSDCPLSQVNELTFRPISKLSQDAKASSLLASASTDHSLRVYRI